MASKFRVPDRKRDQEDVPGFSPPDGSVGMMGPVAPPARLPNQRARIIQPDDDSPTAGEGMDAFLSGRALGNFLSANFGEWGVPGFTREENDGRLRRSGDIIAENAGAVPYIGPVLERGFDLAAPANVALGGRLGFNLAQGAAAAVAGPIARGAARELGFGETGQNVADIAGSIVAPLAAPALGRGARAGARAVDDFLGDAPKGYVDPSRKGILRSQVSPGIGPSDDALRVAGDIAPPPRPSGTQASAAEDLYGLTPAQPESPNRLTQAIDNLKRATRVGVPSDEIATPIMETRKRVKSVADSLAARVGAIADEVEGTFQTDKMGRVTTIPGSPTIQDIAADLMRYTDDLTPRQAEAMNRLRAEVEPIGNAVREQGVEFGTRADVKPGGFYLPRGNAALEGWDAPIKVRSTGRGKAGYRRDAEFESMAQGIDKGYQYTGFPEAMQGYARQGAADTVDAWAANQFKATGLGEAGNGFRDRGVIGLPGMQGVSFPDEIANVANKMLNAEKPSSGKFANVIAVKTAIDAMARMAGSTLDFSGMGLQGLLGLAIDSRAYGTALKIGMKSLANPKAVGTYLKEFDARAVAAGTPTSRDLIKAGQRFGGSVTEFTGQGIPQRIERVVESPIPFTDKIVKGGLNPVRGANRQFGALGDVLRNELSDTAFQIARAKGGDGWSQLPEIVGSANKMTGWTTRRLGGDVGELMNYAPRWMEANIETLVDAARGTLPGANIGQQQSRNAVLRLIGAGTLLTFAANEAMGQETDTRLTIDGRDNPNFMRIRAGGYDISVFGFYDRLVHLVAKSATGDGEGVARSLANAPSVGLAWDLVTGETAIGERTRDTPGQVATTVGSRAVPMSAGEYAASAQAAIEGDPTRAAAAVAVGATGLRGTPLSPSDRIRLGEYDALPPEQQVKSLGTQTWADLAASSKMPERYKSEIAQFSSHYEWKKAAIEQYRQMRIAKGVAPELATAVAEKDFAKNPLEQHYSEVRNVYERRWVQANPSLAIKVMGEDAKLPRDERRLSLNTDELAFLIREAAKAKQ